MESLESWMSLVWAIFFGIISILLKYLGIFNVFEFFSKRLELRNREKRIEDLEELDELRFMNLDNISNLIDFQVIIFRHYLDAAAPKVELQFIIRNYSIFGLNLARFNYMPRLEGVAGGDLEMKEISTSLIIPSQNSNFFNAYFEIPKKLVDQLYEWRKKSDEGRHNSFNWSFSCKAFFIDPIEFQLPMNIRCSTEYYKI